MLFVIIIGANLFSSFMVQTQFPTMLADGASAMNLSAPVVMIMIVLAYIVMGCFLDGIGMVLITVPVFLPMVMNSAMIRSGSGSWSSSSSRSALFIRRSE